MMFLLVFKGGFSFNSRTREGATLQFYVIVPGEEFQFTHP